MIRLIKRATPSAPPANRGRIYYDTTAGKPMFIDENGLTWSLSSDGARDQNLMVNGSFEYAQRQVPGTLTTYSNTVSRVYGPDRFAITNENTSVQYRRVDTISSPQTGMTARFYGEFSKITSTGKLTLSQVAEAGNCMHLRGRKVRFQARLRGSSAKTIRMGLLTNTGPIDNPGGYLNGAPSGNFITAHGANGTDPTFGASLNRIAPDTADNATIAASGLSCSVTTAFQRFSGSFTLPATSFFNVIPIIFTDSQFSVADRLEVTEFGLYDGTEIRDWAEKLRTQELANCQRMYCKSFPLETAPAQNAGLTGAARGYVSVAGATAGQPMGARFPAGSIRGIIGSPLFTFFNPSAANAFARNTTAGTDATATAAANASDSGFDITFTGIAAWTVAQAMAVHWTCDNEI